MDKLKVGDIISFPAEAKFAYGVTFKRPTATREFIIVEAEMKGGDEREGFPSGLHVTSMALDSARNFHRTNHKQFEFVQEEMPGGHCYSNAIAGVKVVGFTNVTVTHTKTYTKKGVKETIAFAVG
jgi:hypothetical protein